MNYKNMFSVLVTVFLWSLHALNAQDRGRQVPEEVMQKVHNEVKTPHKYGLIMVPPDDSKKLDCPTIFRKGKNWYMTYIIYDGRGYETWLAKSGDLLKWTTLGKIMSFSDTTTWDSNQKAGYNALQDLKWGGNYKLQKFDNKYWMSYFGGNTRGYEAGLLSMGIAYTEKNPATPHEWRRPDSPVLKSTDPDARWYDNSTMYKSSVIWDKDKNTGHPFIMYYNARGDSINPAKGAERISMAVSDNMLNWKRYGTTPVINHHVGISGDAIIQKMGDLYVMFYFGAFWKERKGQGAFNRFACSYDLINWTDWNGEDLIRSSEPYDETFAHKSFVIKHKGIVYHFYCAVNSKEQRGIAVATSEDKGKSAMTFFKK
jgi:predicted GH43/DUF377 family glycosyl hydrolase